jgi:hypothetical protein
MGEKLDVANRRLDRALDELRGFNEKLDRLDRRVEHLESEMTLVRAGMEEVTQAVPNMGKGPFEKAKDALTGADQQPAPLPAQAGTLTIVTRYSPGAAYEPSSFVLSRR